MTPRLLATCLLAPALLLLAACEDGVPDTLPGRGTTSDGGVINLQSFTGIWDGAYVGNPPGLPEQWESTFTGFMRDGRLIMFESNGQVWDGDYTLTTAARARSDDVYVFRPDGRRSTRLIIDAAISGDNNLDMSYNLGTAVGLIQMQFLRNPTYERSSSLAQLAGVWSVVVNEESQAPEPPALALAINVVGERAVLDGQNANGCFYSGEIELIDASRNLYDVSEFVVTDGQPGDCDLIVDITETDQEGNVTIVPTPFPFAGDGYSGYVTLPTANSMTLVVTNGDDRAVALDFAR